jgi:uncharacterized protein YcfL
MKRLILFYVSVVFLAIGCNEGQGDSRIKVREGVGSDNVVSNVVTRPVAKAFSALIGEGIEIDEAILVRNKAGLLELHVQGHNRSYSTKKFRYRVEWIDNNGLVIETKTSVWLRTSAMGKSPFSFKVVAPRTEAVDFRMDTRKWE